MGNFNPRSPRGGATASLMPSPPVIYISIHAPHEGERRYCYVQRVICHRFQSTLPTRGSDAGCSDAILKVFIFQSTLPTRGSDLLPLPCHHPGLQFQSTLPTRGSDAQDGETYYPVYIFQSTLPTRGSDSGKVHLYAAFPRIC